MITQKRKKILIVVGIVVTTVLLLGIFNYISLLQHQYPPPLPPKCTLTVTENETCWRIMVTNVSVEDPDSLPGEDVTYFLSRTVEGNYTLLETGRLSEIHGSPSEGYNVTWLDNDNNNLLSKGDEFIISKSGGNEGKAMQGDRFLLVTERGVFEGFSLCAKAL